MRLLLIVNASASSVTERGRVVIQKALSADHEVETATTSRRGHATRLAQGARFGMSMKIGIPYSISNEVVEFEEGRRIAWRHAGHHVWRYELEPAGGKTRVTETFVWSTARVPFMLELLGVPARNRKAMEATLERLERHVTS